MREHYTPDTEHQLPSSPAAEPASAGWAPPPIEAATPARLHADIDVQYVYNALTSLATEIEKTSTVPLPDTDAWYKRVAIRLVNDPNSQIDDD